MIPQPDCRPSVHRAPIALNHKSQTKSHDKISISSVKLFYRERSRTQLSRSQSGFSAVPDSQPGAMQEEFSQFFCKNNPNVLMQPLKYTLFPFGLRACCVVLARMGVCRIGLHLLCRHTQNIDCS